MKTDFQNVLVESEGPISILRLNRPHALNAIDAHTIQELEQALLWLEKKPDLRVLILTGSGDKAFAAGADIRAMKDFSAEKAQHLSQLGQRVFKLIEQFPVPVIASVFGFVLGGGFEFALAADFIIAAENTKLGLPEVTLGLIPGFGGTVRLTQLIGPARSLMMILTGAPVPASRAYELGIVQKVVPVETLLQETKNLAAQISKHSRTALSLAKQSVRFSVDSDSVSSTERESELFAQAFKHPDSQEGICAFLEKRPPRWCS